MTDPELRRKAKAATPGPWYSFGNTLAAYISDNGCPGCSGLDSPAHFPHCGLEQIGSAAPEDVEFIAEFDPPTVIGFLDERDETEEWKNEVASYVPERYDDDSAQEDIILRAVKDMGQRVEAQDQAADELTRLSLWIDEGNEDKDAEAVTWGRLAKLTEESGEVIAAYIGATGQNPRKGVTHGLSDVQEELLDVAITALGAYAHLSGHEDNALDALTDKIHRVAARALGEEGND